MSDQLESALVELELVIGERSTRRVDALDFLSSFARTTDAVIEFLGEEAETDVAAEWARDNIQAFVDLLNSSVHFDVAEQSGVLWVSRIQHTLPPATPPSHLETVMGGVPGWLAWEQMSERRDVQDELTSVRDQLAECRGSCDVLGRENRYLKTGHKVMAVTLFLGAILLALTRFAKPPMSAVGATLFSLAVALYLILTVFGTRIAEHLAAAHASDE